VMYPFSFSEFIRYYEIEPDYVSGSGKSFLISALNRYLEQGGFPGLLDIPEEHHKELLRTYWDTMLLRDIIEAHPTENINSLLLRQFACALASRNSCAMTISKLAGNLSEMGFQFSNETLYRYLSHLNEAYIFDAVEFYSSSEKVRNRNYRKVYCVDWALAASVVFGDHQRKSRYFENMVYLELKRRKKEIRYYRTRDGYEVDFVVSDGSSQNIELIQVSYSMTDEDVRLREIRAIERSAGYLKVKKATIVTFNESDEIKLPDITIQVVPAWRWLLEK
jgi:predicted AAA+ superfamily ATPase